MNSCTVKGQIRQIFAYRALSHGKNFTRKRRRRRSVNRCLLAALLLHDRVSHQTMGRETNYANDSLRLAPLPSLGSTHGRLAEIHNGFRLLGLHTAEDARCRERDEGGEYLSKLAWTSTVRAESKDITKPLFITTTPHHKTTPIDTSLMIPIQKKKPREAIATTIETKGRLKGNR